MLSDGRKFVDVDQTLPFQGSLESWQVLPKKKKRCAKEVNAASGYPSFQAILSSLLTPTFYSSLPLLLSLIE